MSLGVCGNPRGGYKAEEVLFESGIKGVRSRTSTRDRIPEFVVRIEVPKKDRAFIRGVGSETLNNRAVANLSGGSVDIVDRGGVRSDS